MSSEILGRIADVCEGLTKFSVPILFDDERGRTPFKLAPFKLASEASPKLPEFNPHKSNILKFCVEIF